MIAESHATSPDTKPNLPDASRGRRNDQEDPSDSLFRTSFTNRRREDADPGVCKKARIAYEHSVRDRIQHEGMGSVVCTYLVQNPICVGTVLLNYG
jgi:hypothetical protein